MTFDVFISHASEDKAAVVLPLVARLRECGVTVWLDEFELTVGDSLRRSIERGLSESNYGVVILSPAFFSKEWPQRELDALVARETDSAKVILPVWHELDAATVRHYAPLFADKLAVSTARGLEYVAAQIVSAVRRTSRPAVMSEVRREPHRDESQTLRVAKILRAALLASLTAVSVAAMEAAAGLESARQAGDDPASSLSIWVLDPLMYSLGIFVGLELGSTYSRQVSLIAKIMSVGIGCFVAGSSFGLLAMVVTPQEFVAVEHLHEVLWWWLEALGALVGMELARRLTPAMRVNRIVGSALGAVAGLATVAAIEPLSRAVAGYSVFDEAVYWFVYPVDAMALGLFIALREVLHEPLGVWPSSAHVPGA